MKIMMFLVRETPNARLWRRQGQRADTPDKWIPRSVCDHVTKYPAADEKLQLYEVTVQDWWARKNGLTE